MLFVSMPGLIIWAFGMPFMGLYVLNTFLNDLREVKFHSDPQVFKKLHQRFRLRLGFLISGYKDEFYYWEIVVLLRKTIFVLAMVFLSPVSAGV